MAVKLTDKIKTISNLISEPKMLSALLSQAYSGYLIDVGWFNSFKTKTAIDKNNSPIPWTTYPFIDFIESRLNKNLIVFEYGAGNSTLFFGKRVKQVIAVEDDEKWAADLKENIGTNCQIIFEKNPEKYCKVSQDLSQKFDLINVDGGDRNKCIQGSINVLSEAGVIILDDSERPEYHEGIKLLSNGGFKRLDFWGIAPGVLFKKCTTIFYKQNNCLGI